MPTTRVSEYCSLHSNIIPAGSLRYEEYLVRPKKYYLYVLSTAVRQYYYRYCCTYVGLQVCNNTLPGGMLPGGGNDGTAVHTGTNFDHSTWYSYVV